ncbi:MAG TPA: shikimate kinase [Patescibacteria group bacterium]|nr:shikimate kinase [Patescibacteria group bacterium]
MINGEGVSVNGAAGFSADAQRRASGLSLPDGVSANLLITPTEREIFKNINITLVGLPGTGKSTVGKEMAALTGMRYVDTDSLVEEHVGMPVGKYIDKVGRPAFYVLQDSLLKTTLLSGTGKVIGTGGATVEEDRPDNLGIMQMNSAMVYLYSKLDTLVERIMTDDTYRPGLSHDVNLIDGVEVLIRRSPEQVRAELINRYNRRHKAWETAPIKRSTDGQNPNQIAEGTTKDVLKYVRRTSQIATRFQGPQRLIGNA